MNVNCDNCTEDFEIKIQEERVKDDVKRMFFTCPHCNEKFVYFYTNTRIETIKKKLNKVKEKGSKVYTNELKEKYKLK